LCGRSWTMWRRWCRKAGTKDKTGRQVVAGKTVCSLGLDQRHLKQRHLKQRHLKQRHLEQRHLEQRVLHRLYRLSWL
jgi:hypothetical protein